MKRAFAVAALATVALGSLNAHADVRWDLGVSGGAMGRFLSERPVGQGEPSAGPSFEAEGHLVLFPLVRIGAYTHVDESPLALSDLSVTRDVVSGGLDLRLVSPWPQRSVRMYLRAGIGEAGTFEAAGIPAGTASLSGRFTEVPLGLGVAYRPYAPFWLTAEAGARLGVGFAGPIYTTRSSPGRDLTGAYLSVGVMWGR